VRPIENYKKLLNGSHFVVREAVSGSHLVLPSSGSNSQMNTTVISGSHSYGTNLYKWVLLKIKKNLLGGSHFVLRAVVSVSHLVLPSSGSHTQMNSTVICGSDSNGTNFYSWVLWKIIKTY
jgi:hypothetical protein